MLTVNDEIPRPVGTIKISRTGKSHIPEVIRTEIGNLREVPYYLDANIVLLTRSDANLEDILDGMEILKRDLKKRVKKR